MKTYHFGILAVLVLTGCGAHVHQLVKEDNTQFASGELVHDRGEANRLVLVASGRSYEASGFVVERHTNLAVLRKRYYRVNPKHWQRIMSGLDTDHVTYTAETVAKSADGQEISCRLMWGVGGNPAGSCADQSGTVFQVRFE